MKPNEILQLLTEIDPSLNDDDFNDGDIYQKIHELNTELPCMDIDLNLVPDEYYYNNNFDNDNKVYGLFFLGDGDYFPGIWIGNSDISKLDEMPIYMFDLEFEYDEKSSTPIGNIKFYINCLLDDFFNQYTKNDAYYKQALFLKKQILKLSDNMIDKGTFPNNYLE